MPHLASRAIDAKPLSSCDTLRNNFSHWNVNYLKPSYFFCTTFEHSLSSRAKSLHQLRLATVFVSPCVFERARNAVSLPGRTLYAGRMHEAVSNVFFFVVFLSMCVREPKQNLYKNVWTEGSYAWLPFCLFQSNSPTLHQGRQETFVEGSSGSFLVLDSLLPRY